MEQRYPVLVVVGRVVVWGLVAAAASLTGTRLPAFRSNVALWTAAVEAQPQNARARINRAAAALEDGHPELACTDLAATRAVLDRYAPRERALLTRLVAQKDTWIAFFVGMDCSSPGSSP